MKKSKTFLIPIILVIGLGLFLFIRNQRTQRNFFVRPDTPQDQKNRKENNQKPEQNQDRSQEPQHEVLLENLEIPWEIVFLPQDQILLTERPGNVLLLNQDNQNIVEIEGVEHAGEGGLLGAVLSLDFEANKFIYLYYTTTQNEELVNRVVRYQLEDNELTEDTVILEGVPAASYHDGGRMAFGPNGYLYITTGDAGQTDLAQDTNSLAGKILRLNPDGTIPEDNPFNNEVYSYGHRNPQGLAWDNQGRLWATEHGPSGAQSGWDELNLIEAGNNYGWPLVKGEETQQGLTPPVIQSGSDETWAPAGAAFYNGSIYFAGLRGSTLYEYEVESGILQRHLTDVYGRLRAVVLGPDNHLYVSTSNKDGRGSPVESDDRIIRVKPETL